jgi:hypothetical protein
MARGALPQGQGTRVFTGARAIFKFNDSVVGFASGVSGSEEITYEAVDTLDHLEVREHAPTGYRVTFTAQMFRTIATGPSTDVDGPGSIKEQNIFPKFDDILRIQGVDALLQDRISGKIIFLLQQVKTASYNFNVGARGIVGTNVTFVAIRAFDESEIKASP